MSQHKEPAQQHWWAELLLSAASRLDALGFTADGGHVALSGVWEGRRGDSAVGRVLAWCSFTPLFQPLQQPAPVTLPAPIWERRAGIFYLQTPLQPFQRWALAFTCWWAQRSPTHSNCALHTYCERTSHAYKERSVHRHSLSGCVNQHKRRHAQPLSLSEELIIMAMRGERRGDCTSSWGDEEEEMVFWGKINSGGRWKEEEKPNVE